MRSELLLGYMSYLRVCFFTIFPYVCVFPERVHKHYKNNKTCVDPTEKESER